MKPNEVISIALEAGEILLCNGAETYRVEESITKICNGFGYSCETFVLPTGIFLTATSQTQEAQTSVRRIKTRGLLNLSKIDRVNTFSRNLSSRSLTYDQASLELKAIKAAGGYPVPLQLVSAAVASFSFAHIFGGTVSDSFLSMIIGSMIYLVSSMILKSGSFPFFVSFVMGFFCGLFGSLTEYIISGSNVYIIIVSSILLYLPGVAMTNSIRDLLAGDSGSGLSRLGEAVLTVLAIGMGVGFALSLLHLFL